jgi:hypothetical protein
VRATTAGLNGPVASAFTQVAKTPVPICDVLPVPQLVLLSILMPRGRIAIPVGLVMLHDVDPATHTHRVGLVYGLVAVTSLAATVACLAMMAILHVRPPAPALYRGCVYIDRPCHLWHNASTHITRSPALASRRSARLSQRPEARRWAARERRGRGVKPMRGTSSRLVRQHQGLGGAYSFLADSGPVIRLSNRRVEPMVASEARRPASTRL